MCRVTFPNSFYINFNHCKALILQYSKLYPLLNTMAIGINPGTNYRNISKIKKGQISKIVKSKIIHPVERLQ